MERPRPTAVRDEPLLPRSGSPRARSATATRSAELARHYRPDVQRLCRRLLGSAAEAEDVCQESLARAHAALASYDPARPFRRWLLAIAAHRAIDALRRRRREARLFEHEPPDADAHADPAPVAAPARPLGRAAHAAARGDRAAARSLPRAARASLLRRPRLRARSPRSWPLSRNQVATLLFRARAPAARRPSGALCA